MGRPFQTVARVARSWFSSLSLCALLLVSAASSNDNPSEALNRSPQPVTLTSLVQAEAFARQVLLQAQALEASGVTVSGVDVYHVGRGKPAALAAFQEAVHRAGLNVNYQWMTPDFVDAAIEAQQNSIAPAVPEILDYAIRYDQPEKDSSAPPGLTSEKIKASLQEARAKLRSFFGVSGGITFASYKIDRTPQERWTEAAIAVGKASATSWVLYHRLEDLKASGHEVNMWLPIVVNCAFSFFFDYFQQGNSLFKKQGKQFSFKRGAFSMDYKFFFFSAVIHSIIMRESLMLATYGSQMNWQHATDAISTTLRGALGRVPIELLIARNQEFRPRWQTIGMFAMFGALYSSLAIMDLYDQTGVYRATLAVLGTLGGGYELFKKSSRIEHWLKRIVKRLKGVRPEPINCETYLVFKTTI